jgi:hypothetical protein
MSQRVQVAGLEPSTPQSPTFYAIQIRGMDSEGNPGPWSREFVFQSLDEIPPEIEDIIDTETIEIAENDILLYDGSIWKGSNILFDDTFIRADGTVSFINPVAGVEPEADLDLATKKYVDDSVLQGPTGPEGPAKEFSQATLSPSSGTVEIDFDEAEYFTHSIDNDVTYETANLAPAQFVIIKITTTDAATLSFPDWKFVGSAPPPLGAGQNALLVLHSFGTDDEDCIARIDIAT